MSVKSLGTLALRMRADRQQLKLDLAAAETQVKASADNLKQMIDKALALTLNFDRVGLDRAVDQVRKTHDQLVELFEDSLKIKVDDHRLTELNAHFKIKERDYQRLQRIFDNSLVINVDDRNLSSLASKIRDIDTAQVIGFKAEVNSEAIDRFHDRLQEYARDAAIHVNAIVDTHPLSKLYNELRELTASEFIANVGIKVSDRLDELESRLSKLSSNSIDIKTDGLEVRKLEKMLQGFGSKSIDLNFSDRHVGKLSKSIESAVKQGMAAGASNSAMGAIASPLKSVFKGAMEGLGRDLFSSVSKSFSSTIGQSLGNTIGSADLVGRRLAESGTRKVQNFANQLGSENPAARGAIVQVQQAIRESLGEREVAIAANKGRGVAAKRSRADLGLAREGVLEELRSAEADKESSMSAAVATYRRVKPIQARIDRRDAPFQAQLKAIREEKQRFVDEFAAQQSADIARLQEQLASAQTPAQSSAIASAIGRVSSKKANTSKFDNRESIVQQQRAPVQRLQDMVDSRLESAQANVQTSEDRFANAFQQAKVLQRQKQPKVVQDILDEIAPNLPDHLVPRIESDATLKQQGELAHYNVGRNNIRLQPDIYKALQSGQKLDENQYKSIREELEHAKDMSFGKFEGFQSFNENRLLEKPVKASPSEESAIAQELQAYDPKARIFERNAKIRRDRGYKKYKAAETRDEIAEFAGLGGQQFDQSFNPSNIAGDVKRTSAAATRRGVNLPSLQKLETKTLQLQAEHSRLMEQIGKALANELSPEHLDKLSNDIEAQVKAVVSTKQRIAGAQKGLIKSVDRQKQAPQKTTIQKVGSSIAHSADRAITPHVNNLLSKVPGQPGVLDYGQDISSLTELNPSHYGKIAQIGLESGTNLLRNAAGVVQKGGAFLQGAENVALSLMPGGKAIKAGLQHTVLPAAAFQAATHFIPGGQAASHALQAATHGVMSLPGHGMGAAANQLISQTIGQVPMLGNSLSTATSALATGAIDAATSAGAGLLAPVLGGKAILNAGRQAFKQIAPTEDNSRMLAVGESVANRLQQPIQLPMQLQAGVHETIETGRQMFAAAQSKLITQTIEPITALNPAPSKSLPPAKPKKQQPVLPDPGFIDVDGVRTEIQGDKRSAIESGMSQGVVAGIKAGKINEKGGLSRAREIRDSMDRGWKQFNEALSNKDRIEAQRIGQTLTNNLNAAEKEIADIAAALGSSVKSSTSKGLNQSRNRVTKVRADLQRSATKQRLNFKSNDDLDDLRLSNLAPAEVDNIPWEELYQSPTKESFSSIANTRSRYGLMKRQRNRRQNIVDRHVAAAQEGVVYENPNYQPDQYSGVTIQPSAVISKKRIPAATVTSLFDPNSPDPSWPDGMFGSAIYGEQYQTKSVATESQRSELIPTTQLSLGERLKSKARSVMSRKKWRYNASSDPVAAGYEAQASAGANIAKFEKVEAMIVAKESKNLAMMGNDGSGASESPIQRMMRVIKSESSGAREGLASLANVAGSVLKTFTAFAGVAIALGVIKKIGGDSIEAAIKMQSLTQSIEAISRSKIDAKALIASSTAQSNKLGYNAVSGLEQDNAFAAAAKDTSLELVGGGITAGLRQYNRVLGVDDQRAQLSQLGLMQMISKGGTPQLEDIRGQIGESSPGAINVMARSMGMSSTQFNRALSEKTIATVDLAPRFGQQAAAESAAGVEAASKSTAAAMGRLGNSVTALQAAAGEKFLAPATAGMESASSVANILRENMDTLAKVFIAALIAGAAGAASLAGGLSLASPLVGMLVKGLIVAAPALAAFAIQAAVAYASIEVFSTAMNLVNDSSPMKSYADEAVANLARIQDATAETAKAIADLQDKEYGKNRNFFQQAGDAITGSIGGYTSVDLNKDRDTVNAYKLIEANQGILAQKEAPKVTRQRLTRLGEIDNELSLVRAENAKLTSKDGDKLDANNKKEQKLIAERTKLEDPRTQRSGQLESQLKGLREIEKNPIYSDRPQLQAAARAQIAQIEAEQRTISSQFNNTARDMMVNLQRLSSSFVRANQAIEQSASNARIKSANDSSNDPLNSGASTRASYLNTRSEQSAKVQNAQNTIAALDQTLGTKTNQGILQRLQLDPKNFSQGDFDRASKDLSDEQGKQLLGYLTQYKEAMAQLQSSNESLSNNQTGYIKAVAEYNKQYGDKLVAMRSRFVSLLLNARSQIEQVEQSVAERLLDIDKSAASILAKTQKNKMQEAYNKFLGKLGIATDDVFDTIFEGFNSILEIFDKVKDLSFSDRAVQLKYKSTIQSNSSKFNQAEVGEQESNAAARRELRDTQQANPANNFGSTVQPSQGVTNGVASPIANTTVDQFLNYKEVLEAQKPTAYRNRKGRTEKTTKGNTIGDVHGALDIGTGMGVRRGSVVQAAFDGTATLTDRGRYGAGVRLVGKAADGTRLRAEYLHLSYAESKKYFPGGKPINVTAGMPFGVVGSEGKVFRDGTKTGNEDHLDYRTYRNDVLVQDPRDFTRQLIASNRGSQNQPMMSRSSVRSTHQSPTQFTPAQTNLNGFQSYLLQDMQGNIVQSKNPNQSPKSVGSSIKLIVADTVSQRVRDGKLKLDQRVPLDQSLFAQNDDSINKSTRSMTVRELISTTVGKSSNTGANQLIKLLGGTKAASAAIKQAGYSNSDLNNYFSMGGNPKNPNQTTVADLNKALINASNSNDPGSQLIKSSLQNAESKLKFTGEVGTKIANTSSILGGASLVNINGNNYALSQFTETADSPAARRSVKERINRSLSNIKKPQQASQQQRTQQRSSQSQQSPYTDVVSSWYTPGQGGAINGGNEDMMGRYIDNNSLVMATRTTNSPQGIPYGSKVEVRDPKTKKTVVVTVTDRGTLRPGRDIDLTPAAAKQLGVTPDGVTKLQMRVLSVPKGKKLASSYNLGGGIGSYDNKGNYTGAKGTDIMTQNPAQSNRLTESNAGLDLSNKGYGSNNQGDVLAATEKLSNQYLGDLKAGILQDNAAASTQGKQTIEGNRIEVDGLNAQARQLVIKNRSKLQQQTFDADRKGTRLIDEARAGNESRDRSAYENIEGVSQQFGNIRDRSTLDQSGVEAQQFIQRTTTERVDQGRSLENEINRIQAQGTGWEAQRKLVVAAIAEAKKAGNKYQASIYEEMLRDNDKAVGTPESRQQRINALSAQYKALPSVGVVAYDATASSVKPALTAARDLKEQYLPRTMDDRQMVEARSIVDRFQAVKATVLTEIAKLDSVATLLENDIQSKLKAAGYAPQKIDLNDPKRVALLKQVAPEETSRLIAANSARLELNTASENIDINAQTAASRSLSNARIRDSIAVDRADLDYYSKTQQGNLYTQQNIDATSFQLGKRELDLDLSEGVISAEMYAQKIRALKLETDTLTNAMKPLREASNNFFGDMFKNKDLLAGIGDAFRGLAKSILEQMQGLISQHLGQLLFKSLTDGMKDVANDKSETSTFSIANLAKQGMKLLGMNDTRAIDNNESMPKPSDVIGENWAEMMPSISFGDENADAYDEGQSIFNPNYKPRSLDAQFNTGGSNLMQQLTGSLFNIGQNIFNPNQNNSDKKNGGSGGFLDSLLGFGMSALKIPGFATGGMISDPTLALVGEGANNEAIVPLPNGRSIPVDLKNLGASGGGNSINSPVTVSIDNSGGKSEISKGDASALANAIKGSVLDTIAQELRPGGLLSR
jgi:tape measure domain-containing protein